MSEIEDRLRSALATAPSPQTTIVDPLADLDRRVSKARMRLSGVAMVAVIAVVAAIVVPLSLIGSGGSGRKTSPAKASLQPWNATNVDSFTTGGGFVWTVVTQPSPGAEKFAVQQRDPATGKVLETFPVGTPEQNIAYGFEQLWTWGGGDGGYPDGVLDVHDVAGNPVSHVSLGNGHGLSALSTAADSVMAFAPNGWAYGVRENGTAVVGFNGGELSSSSIVTRATTGARRVFLAGETLLVVGDHGVIAQYPTGDGGLPASSQAVTVQGVPLATGPNLVWARIGASLVREDLSGNRYAAMPTPGDPVDAEVTSDGGLFVAYQRDRNRPTGTNELAFYSAAALSSGSPRPTATVGGKFDNIALDSAGGVVAGTTPSGVKTARLVRWNPSHQATSAVATATVWPSGEADAVTFGGGAVWALDNRTTPGHNHLYVEKRSSSNGAVVSSIAIKEPGESIYYGLGKVWVVGGGDGGHRNVVLTMVDPTTGAVTRTVLGPNYGIGSAAFAGGYEWFAAPLQRQILKVSIVNGAPQITKLTWSGRPLTLTPIPNPGRPTQLLVTSYSQRMLAPLVLATGSAGAAPASSYLSNWAVLGPAGGDSVWASKGQQLIRDVMTDTDGSGVSARIALPGQRHADDVVSNSDHSIYVEVGSPTGPAGPDIEFFTQEEYESPHPHPLATDSGHQISSLSVGPSGGALFTTYGTRQLLFWDPALSPPQ